jgi:acetyl esterase
MLHPQAKALLELIQKVGLPPTHTLAPDEARRTYRERRAYTQPAAPEVASVAALVADGVPLRLYRPRGSRETERLPVLVYFHGGGWVIGDLDTHDTLCRELANGSGCAIVAVDYRLAPEHKFPAGIDDAVAAYRWLQAEATELGVDPARIVIAGDSAGGNVAAVAAQLLRDEDRPPCLQWLIFPATDFSFDTASNRSCGEGFMVTRAAMEWFRGHYLNGQADIGDPRASPLKANDLAGLPPALVYTAGFDPLRDEGQAYADRLTAAGVKTIHHEFESLIHGFVGLRGTVQAAARAMDDMVAGLRHELAQLGR